MTIDTPTLSKEERKAAKAARREKKRQRTETPAADGEPVATESAATDNAAPGGIKAEPLSTADTDNVLASLKKPKKSAVSVKSEPTTDDTTEPATKAVRLFVGNVAFQATDKELLEAFDPNSEGKVVGMHYVSDKQTGLWYGSVMVDMVDQEAANNALRMNGKQICNRPIKVNIATGVIQANQKHYNQKPKPGDKILQPDTKHVSEKPADCKTVFLGNCSYEVTDDIIKELFSECGTITDVRWVERDGVFKGCGFVEFEEADGVDKAVQFNGRSVLGRKMRVDYAPAK